MTTYVKSPCFMGHLLWILLFNVGIWKEVTISTFSSSVARSSFATRIRFSEELILFDSESLTTFQKDLLPAF